MSVNWFEFADFLLFAEELGCRSFVNTVPKPDEFDIEKMPIDDLRAAVAEMERQEREQLQELRLNRPRWNAHLGRLKAILHAREDGTEVWVEPLMAPARATGSVAGTPVAAPSRPPAPESAERAREAARALAEEWAAPGEVGELTIDDRQRITAADPSVAGCATEGWVGTNVLSTLEAAWGADPSGWDVVELAETTDVVCLAGIATPRPDEQRSVRAFVWREARADGRFEFRVFLASRPSDP
jgi:hypothetical protein